MRAVKPLVIVQARMGSYRLPGKVLARLGDRTVLEHVLSRVRQAGLKRIVVATTWHPEDDAIRDICSVLGVDCFRGHDRDVLRRFVDCHAERGGNPIVRVTADCPLLEPSLLAEVAKLAASGRFDYVGVKGAPDGYHQEAFTSQALALTHRLARSDYDREHVVPFMLVRPAMFRLGWVQANIDGDPVTLDTPEDLERLRGLVARAA